MAFRQNNPLSRKTSPINKNWIKGAIKRPGAFKKKAEEAGMSTKAFAEKVTSNKDNYDARTGKQAELAETLMGMSRESFTMDELDKSSKKEKVESKKQADKLPQIEFPGSDYEMDQDMSYPGGERGRDYDEEGTKNGMSRHTSEHSTEEYMARKDAAIKKAKGVSRVASPLNVGGMDDMEGIDNGKEEKSEEKKPGNSKAEIKARKSKEKSEGVSGSKRRANKAKSKSEAAAEKAKTAKNPDYKKQLEAKSERLAKRSKRKEERSKRKARNKKTRNENKESRKSQNSPLEKNCKYKK